MKRITLIAVVAVVMAACASVSASAQFRFGLRVGTNVGSFHFNSKTFDTDNRMGFNAGAMVEFTVPVVGVGFDASVMYVRRNSRWAQEAGVELKDNRDYIDIPLNFKWRMNIPVINNVVRPFLTTGPSFSFLTSGRAISQVYRNRKFDTAWNFGFGLELFKHLQLGASYGLGMTKALKAVGATSTAGIEGKNRYWTVSAAYMF
ncbi:MAG: PorT family protein [Muribaculaceae bacterium]|nr:PorT family protein [Muribaculaceae bacterium]